MFDIIQFLKDIWNGPPTRPEVFEVRVVRPKLEDVPITGVMVHIMGPVDGLPPARATVEEDGTLIITVFDESMLVDLRDKANYAYQHEEDRLQEILCPVLACARKRRLRECL